MSPKVKVFMDSDVIISSLLSDKGVSRLLLKTTTLSFFVSNFSLKELKKVTKRLKISGEELNRLINTKFKIVGLSQSNKILKRRFNHYVLDENDSHIIAGAKKASCRFLISYNTKHFKSDLIKKDFGILVYKPAILLQYLRSS